MKPATLLQRIRACLLLSAWLLGFSAMGDGGAGQDGPVTIRPQRARGAEGELRHPGLMRRDPSMDQWRRVLDHFRPENGRLVSLPAAGGEKGEGRVVSRGPHRVAASSHGRWKRMVYAPENAFDRDHRTAWVEGRPGHGVGEWLELRFRSRFENPEQMHKALDRQAGMRPRLAGLVIVPGYAKNRLMYRNNNRPRRLDARLSWKEAGGSSQTRTYRLILDDARRPQVFVLPEPVTVFGQVRLRLTVRSLYRGARFPDTCIAEIGLFFTDERSI